MNTATSEHVSAIPLNDQSGTPPTAEKGWTVREVFAGGMMAVKAVAILAAYLMGAATILNMDALWNSKPLPISGKTIVGIMVAVLGGIVHTGKWSFWRCKERHMDSRCRIFLALFALMLFVFLGSQLLVDLTVTAEDNEMHRVIPLPMLFSCLWNYGIWRTSSPHIPAGLFFILSPLFSWLCYVIATMAIVVLAIIVVALRKNHRKPTSRHSPPKESESLLPEPSSSNAPASSPATSLPLATPPVSPEPAVALPSAPFAVPLTPAPGHESAIPETAPQWPVAPRAKDGISHDWAEFASERLAELAPRQNRDETKWALGVVDFLDELKESETDSSPSERALSASLRETLVAFLATKGFAPVDADEWNPALQRAVAVVRKPDATGTHVLGKGATGLSRQGTIIRKQEVKIETKGI